MKLIYKKKPSRGITLIELMIAVSITGIVMYGIYRTFNNFFDIWKISSAQINVQQKARIIMDEMAKFIRAAKPAADLKVDKNGPLEGRRITFTYFDGRNFSYYRDGIVLWREIDGVKKRLLKEKVENLYFIVNSTFNPTVVQISSMTVINGHQTINLNRKIYLRNK